MTLRKPTWRSLAVLLCLGLWPAAVHAQSPELVDAHNRYSELTAYALCSGATNML